MNDADRTLFPETLHRGVAALDLPLTDAAAAAFGVYAERLLAFNAHTNLTRITEPAAMAIKHFVDSLTLLRAVEPPEGASLVDVGTGAGFPGMVLAIARPDLRVVLVDSLGKRLTFLQEVADALGVTNVALVHARAEEVGRDRKHRDRYDLVTARAVAALPTLLEWCAPLARTGGRFVAMKAGGVDDELAASAEAQRLLAVSLTDDIPLRLPPVSGEAEAEAARRLLVFEKRRPTPPRFPRPTAEIKRLPLGGPVTAQAAGNRDQARRMGGSE